MFHYSLNEQVATVDSKLALTHSQYIQIPTGSSRLLSLTLKYFVAMTANTCFKYILLCTFLIKKGRRKRWKAQITNVIVKYVVHDLHVSSGMIRKKVFNPMWDMFFILWGVIILNLPIWAVFPVCVCFQVTWQSSCLWPWWESTATRWFSVDGTRRTCPSSHLLLTALSHSGHTIHSAHTRKQLAAIIWKTHSPETTLLLPHYQQLSRPFDTLDTRHTHKQVNEPFTPVL